MTKLQVLFASIFVSEYRFTGRMGARDSEVERVFVELEIYDLYYEKWTIYWADTDDMDEEDYSQFKQVRKGRK